MTNDELDLFNDLIKSDWYKERPQIVKDIINKLPPTIAYRVKETDQKCVIYSYRAANDDTLDKVTLTVVVIDPISNSPTHLVSGLKVEDFEPWDKAPIP